MQIKKPLDPFDVRYCIFSKSCNPCIWFCASLFQKPLGWVTTPLRLLAPLIWYWPKDNRTSSLYALIQSKPILRHNLAHKMATHLKAHKLSFRELCEWQPYKHWCSYHWHYKSLFLCNDNLVRDFVICCMDTSNSLRNTGIQTLPPCRRVHEYNLWTIHCSWLE